MRESVDGRQLMDVEVKADARRRGSGWDVIKIEDGLNKSTGRGKDETKGNGSRETRETRETRGTRATSEGGRVRGRVRASGEVDEDEFRRRTYYYSL